MRHIPLPGPVNLPIPTDGKGTLLEYTLERYLYENVWPHEIWRESQANQQAFFRLHAKFTESFKENARFVSIEDADYELLLPVATQRGVKLRPELVVPLQTLLQVFFNATPKPPITESSS